MPSFVGCDVSSKRLDVFVIGSNLSRSFANDARGCQSLVAWLSGQDVRVVMEATSTYHREAFEALKSAGMDVRPINPRQARDLARGMGLRLKNDKVDAKVLAICAQHDLAKRPAPRSELQDRYRDLSRQIQDLTEKSTNAKKKAQTRGLAQEIVASLRREIAFYAKEIERLETQAAKLAKKDPEIQRCFELAESVPGVGIKTARVVVAELSLSPEALNPECVASYASVVPQENASGDSKRASRIGRRGNSRLRKALFMPATRLAFRQGPYQDLYLRLRAKGHEHMQAIVALMRKLIRTIAAVLKRRSPWLAQTLT